MLMEKWVSIASNVLARSTAHAAISLAGVELLGTSSGNVAITNEVNATITNDQRPFEGLGTLKLIC